jgi:hypothetical protein
MSAVCPSCRRTIIYTGDEEPPSCGRPYCRAITTWSVDKWAGRARMALTRRACGLDLYEWDHEALRRGGLG